MVIFPNLWWPVGHQLSMCQARAKKLTRGSKTLANSVKSERLSPGKIGIKIDKLRFPDQNDYGVGRLGNRKLTMTPDPYIHVCWHSPRVAVNHVNFHSNHCWSSHVIQPRPGNDCGSVHCGTLIFTPKCFVLDVHPTKKWYQRSRVPKWPHQHHNPLEISTHLQNISLSVLPLCGWTQSGCC